MTDDSTANDPAGVWDDRPAMNAFETMMWRGESQDPRLHSATVAVEVLAHSPGTRAFREAFRVAAAAVPRLRQRVVEPPLGLGAPHWSTVEGFDPDRHVGCRQVPAPGGWVGLLAEAARIGREPFDRARPPWEAVLVEGLPGGRAACVLKLHHAAADGVGIVQLLGALHAPPGSPPPQAHAPAPVTPLGVLAAQAEDDVRAAPGLLAATGRTAWRAVTDPVRALGWARSARRVFTPPAASPSPLLAGRGDDWRFLALDVDLAALRGAGKAAGGSLNDAYLAGLLGGIRRYHEEMGSPVGAIPLTLPLSLRRDDDPGGGNRIASAAISAPVGVAEPAARIRAVGERVRLARAEPAVDNVGLIAPVLARMPAPVVARAATGMTAGTDVQASNVPGVREEIALAGAPVERIYPYAPRPGCAAMVTLLTHGDTCCVGANVDPAAITEPDRFGRCLAEGFAEVLALVPDAPEPVLR